MERDLAGADLSSSDFRRLAQACRLDARFPATYDAWKAAVEAGDRMLIDQGMPVVPVPIDVDDFVAWCQRVDVAPCLDGLRAYLILIRRRQHIPGTSPTGPRAKRRAAQRRGSTDAAAHAWMLARRAGQEAGVALEGCRS
jgi:hypothetical protein